MTFWGWFIRPFAEAAAGLVLVAGLLALVGAFLLADECWRRSRRWWKRRA